MKQKIKVFLAVEVVMFLIFGIVSYTMYSKLSHKYSNQMGRIGWKYTTDLIEHESINKYCIRNGIQPYEEKTPTEVLEECVGALTINSTKESTGEGNYIIAKCYDKDNKVVAESGPMILLWFQNDSDDMKNVYAYMEPYFSKEQLQPIYEFQEKHMGTEISRLEGYYEGEQFVITSMTLKEVNGKASRTIENATDHKTVVYTKETKGLTMYTGFLRTEAMKRPVYYQGDGLSGFFDYLVEKYEASRSKRIQAYTEAQFAAWTASGAGEVDAEWLEGTTGDVEEQEFSYQGEKYRIRYSFMIDCNYIALAESWLTNILADIFYFLQAAAIIFSILLYKIYQKKKRLDYAKVVLTNGVAHELKTPLAVIKNYGECIEGHVNPEKDAYYLSSMINEADLMNSMVVNLLNYTKLSNEEYRIKKELTALDELAIEVLKEKEEVIKQKDIDVSINCSGCMEVSCDSALIKMVIENYLTNAITYTPPQKKIELTIIQKRSWLQNTVTCSVYNEGSYLTATEKRYIWDVFYRADKSRNRKENSTGFGLAICKHIIKLHKGKYGCVDAPSGIQFYFTIPTGYYKNK